MRALDIVHVAPVAATSRVAVDVAARLRVEQAAGYRSALLAAHDPRLGAFLPAVPADTSGGGSLFLAPEEAAEARLALVHDPRLLPGLAARPPRLRARDVVLVAGTSPFTEAGRAAFVPAQLERAAEGLIGGRVRWLGATPTILRQLAPLTTTLMADAVPWWPLLPHAEERASPLPPRGPAAPLVIGRRMAGDLADWPPTREALLQALPEVPGVRVRLHGWTRSLQDRYGEPPPAWELAPASESPADFLGSLDVLVYLRPGAAQGPPGPALGEALAHGLLAIAHPADAEAVAGAALGATAEALPALLERLRASPGQIEERTAQARRIVAERLGPETYLRRLGELCGPPSPAPRPRRAGRGRAARSPGPRMPVVFMSSNGVGIGHLTRLLGIARRCSPRLEPVFVSLSQAVQVIEAEGFYAQYIPFSRGLGADGRLWNAFLQEELGELFRFYEPSALVFDGNMPYTGILAAVRRRPAMWLVWVRRGLWRPGAGQAALEREAQVDLVLEPGDLAEALDAGATTTSRRRTVRVPPVTLLRRNELLGRAAARAALDLPAEGTLVLVHLGAENNFSFELFRRRCFELLGERPDVRVVLIDNIIADRQADAPDFVLRRQVYPVARYLAAFDAVIAAVGYNTFHEVLLAGTPAIFVPNENTAMDDQAARAAYAERLGVGFSVSPTNPYGLKRALAAILTPEVREDMRRRAVGTGELDGGPEAARLLESLARTTRLQLRSTS